MHEGTQVGFAAERGSRRDDLHRRGRGVLALVLLPRGGRGEVGGGQDFLAGVVPVEGEDGLDLGDDPAGEADAGVVVGDAGFLEGGRVVVRGDQVVGADVGLSPVDDQELAVVAQVGAANMSAQGREGEHLVPEDAHVIQATPEAPVPRYGAHAVVIDEETHGDAAGLRALEGLVEGSGVFVPGGLKVEGVDVVGSPINAGGHRTEGVGRLIVQGDDVAAGVGEAAERTGQAHERGGVVVGAVGSLVGGRLGLGGVFQDGLDEGAGLGIVIEASSHGPPGTEDEVEGHSKERPQEDEEQPRGRRGGAPVFGHDTQRHDTDGEFNGSKEEPRPQRWFGVRGKHTPILQSALCPGQPSVASVARRSLRRARGPACGVRPRRGPQSRWTGRRRRPTRRSLR